MKMSSYTMSFMHSLILKTRFVDPLGVKCCPRYLDYKNAYEIVPDRISSFFQRECDKTQEHTKQCGPFQELQTIQEFEKCWSWV